MTTPARLYAQILGNTARGEGVLLSFTADFK